jgi:hypothetical protein
MHVADGAQSPCRHWPTVGRPGVCLPRYLVPTQTFCNWLSVCTQQYTDTCAHTPGELLHLIHGWHFEPTQMFYNWLSVCTQQYTDTWAHTPGELLHLILGWHFEGEPEDLLPGALKSL